MYVTVSYYEWLVVVVKCAAVVERLQTTQQGSRAAQDQTSLNLEVL